MPMKTAYYTVDGEILAQESSGQRVDYLPDALGSVVTTANQTKSVTGTARFKPYGADLQLVGQQPQFLWSGRSGYRPIKGLSSYYVRQRWYRSPAAVWTSIDPLATSIKIALPKQHPVILKDYAFVYGNPITYKDPTGLAGESDDGVPLEGCIGLTFSNLPIPLPIFRILKPSVKLKACFTGYTCEKSCNNTDLGCPPSDLCMKASLSFCLSLDPTSIGYGDLLKLLGSTEDKWALDTLANLVLGTAGMITTVASPTHECIPHKDNYGLEASLTLCNLGFQLYAKSAIGRFWSCPGPEAWTSSASSGRKWSNCGIVKLELCVGFFFERCS